MIIVKLIVQLHHGHEFEAFLPWDSEELPGPTEIITELQVKGDLFGWRVGSDGPVESRIKWDPHETVSVITERSDYNGPDTGVLCTCGEKNVIVGLECPRCGDLVGGQ